MFDRNSGKGSLLLSIRLMIPDYSSRKFFKNDYILYKSFAFGTSLYGQISGTKNPSAIFNGGVRKFSDNTASHQGVT